MLLGKRLITDDPIIIRGNAISSVSLSYRLNQAYLKPRSGTSEVFLEIEVSPNAAPNMPEKPLNVCLVFDRSQSMKEENKLEMAKLAANQLVQSMRPSDFISMVTFADKARLEVQSGPIRDCATLCKTIHQIKAGGNTDIYSALELSLQEILNQRKFFHGESVSRIVLVTDGQPTRGKQEIDDFVPISGEVQRNGVSVTAVGVGSDYNERLLSMLALNTEGKWYHVREPRELPRIFATELEQMTTILVTRPELLIKPLTGVRVSEIYTVKPALVKIENAVISAGEYCLRLNDIVADEPQYIVAKLSLPSKNTGEYRIAEVDLKSGDTSLHSDVLITFTDDSDWYGIETDPYPRLLLLLSDATRLLGMGINENDETKISDAETIVESAGLDSPKAQDALKSNGLLDDLWKTFNDNSKYATILITKKEISKDDKKQALQDTTYISKKARKQV